MDKNWWKRLKQNKALKLFKTYLYTIINNLNEREIKGHMFKKGLNINEILIQESSKEIDNYLKLKIKNKKKHTNNTSISIIENTENEKKINKRNISLLYMCLLKFNGLLRYMYFQGLNHEDINKMAHFIRYTFRKKGEYVFRQNDKSDALYGVIKGKAVIRLVNTIDYTKKFMSEASNGIDFYNNHDHNINIQYFMSDCEIESDDEKIENISENENDNESKDFQNNENKKFIFENEFSKNRILLKNKKHFNTLRNNSHNKLSFKNDNKSNSHLKNILNDKKIRKKLSQPKFFSEYDLDNLIESKIKKQLKKKIYENEKELNEEKIRKNFKKIIKQNKNENIKIIKAIKINQTPLEKLEGEILENFIKEFEIETFTLTNGMCFGEWGLLYSIPRTTSIYASEDTDLFYLEKEYFNKILFNKFLKNDYEKIHFLIHKFPIFKNGFKIRHIFTKIIPLFVNKDNIIYTPFNKAENIYLIYQGEGILVNLPNAKDEEDFFIRKNNLNVISRLQEGAIAGIESCLDIKKNYEYGFIITRDFTTLLKINIQFISELYKDFNKSLIPLYKSQQLLYQKIKQTSEKIKLKENVKKKFSLSKVVKDVLNKDKKRSFSNDFKYKEKIIKYDNNINIKNIKVQISKKKIKEFKLKIQNNNSKKNLMSNKNILENLSTNRQSNISPLSSERIKNEIEKKPLTPLNEKSDFFSKNKKSNSQLDEINNIYKTKDSFVMTVGHFRNNSDLSIRNNYNILFNKKKIEKFNKELIRKKLLSFQNINTGQFILPLLTDMNKNNLIF